MYPTYLGGSWQLNTPLPAASFADIERWESDTDSGGSDEEVDFKEGNNLSNTQVLALCM